jgi:hypothetical protein
VRRAPHHSFIALGTAQHPSASHLSHALHRSLLPGAAHCGRCSSCNAARIALPLAVPTVQRRRKPFGPSHIIRTRSWPSSATTISWAGAGPACERLRSRYLSGRAWHVACNIQPGPEANNPRGAVATHVAIQMHHVVVGEKQSRWGGMQRTVRLAACSGLDPCRVCSGSANGGLAVHDVRKGTQRRCGLR